VTCDPGKNMRHWSEEMFEDRQPGPFGADGGFIFWLDSFSCFCTPTTPTFEPVVRWCIGSMTLDCSKTSSSLRRSTRPHSSTSSSSHTPPSPPFQPMVPPPTRPLPRRSWVLPLRFPVRMKRLERMQVQLTIGPRSSRRLNVSSLNLRPL
jgi:hypothetical protein